jgi:hypothetical protein
MHRWLIGFFLLFAVMGWMVLSGTIHLAAEAAKLVAYGAFGIAAILLALGLYAFTKVKGMLHDQPHP